MQTRWQEIRKIHVEWADAYRVFGGVVLVLLGIWIGSFLFAVDGPLYSEDGYRTNLYTEFISITVTIFVLDRLAAQRERRREKRRLINELRSDVNHLARRAAEELRANNWLEDGSLSGISLERANLEQVNLECANLQKVKLGNAFLEHADLSCADLRNAIIDNANASESSLWGANLEGASLIGTNLQSAGLFKANLKGANLLQTIFDKHTFLPDGTHWTPETKMDRFTDPNHPDFWQPEWVKEEREQVQK